MKKTISKIVLIAICLFTIQLNATAQKGKVLRPRTASPVTTVPVSTAVKVDTPKTYVSTVLKTMDNATLDNLAQLAVQKCSMSGLITMPKEAFLGILTDNINNELYLQAYYLDSNLAISKPVRISATLSTAPSTHVPIGKIGFYYSITNIPVDKEMFIRLMPINLSNWKFDKNGDGLFFRNITDNGNDRFSFSFDGDPKYGGARRPGDKLIAYTGYNTFRVPNKAIVCDAEYIYQPWGSPH